MPLSLHRKSFLSGGIPTGWYVLSHTPFEGVKKKGLTMPAAWYMYFIAIRTTRSVFLGI